MRCQPYRDAVSARIDGEDPGMADRLIDGHLQRCGPCREFASATMALRQRVAVRVADAVPDLTASVMATAAPLRRAARGDASARSVVGSSGAVAGPARGSHWSRWALLVVGLSQLVVAVPPMIFGYDAGASMHAARELGAWNVALGAALLAVVLRPARAGGLVPFAGALALTMVLGAVADLVSGRTAVVAESQHLLELVGLVLLWITARRPVDPGGLLDGLRRHRRTAVAT